MRVLVVLIAMFAVLIVSCQHTTAVSVKAAATAPESKLQSFDRIWAVAKANIYPRNLENTFTKIKSEELRSRISENSSLQDLAESLNPFLSELGISHTHLYVEGDPDYYFFRSLFSSHQPDSPKIFHIGAQYKVENGVYILRSLLQGYAAEKSGLRRGDKLLRVNGSPFHPVRSFASGADLYTLEFMREGRLHKSNIKPIFEAIPESFLTATMNSVKKIRHGGKTVGYVKLWTGAFNSDRILSDIVLNQLGQVDSLILDLRDGFGAAWWNHLDPFFPNRSSYYVASVENRDGTIEVNKPEQKTNASFFAKPMVVLINEGVRSGKEAMAYQFKKTGRAKLIGTTTAGAFVSGRGFFAEEDNGYILYLAINGITLDGTRIEGVGIKPDREVPYPFSKAKDPQLTEAIRELTKI